MVAFDLFHIGHLRYLEAAAMMGDVLKVGVTCDANVNKGPGRPLYNESERSAIILSLRCVDGVTVVENALHALQIYKPHIFVKGREYEGKIEKIHQDYCDAHGIEIRFTDTETVRPRDRLRQG